MSASAAPEPASTFSAQISYETVGETPVDDEADGLPPPLTESLMVPTAGLVLATTAQLTMLLARLRAAMAFTRASVSAPEVWSGAPPAHRVDP